jgi:hypothetical protein
MASVATNSGRLKRAADQRCPVEPPSNRSIRTAPAHNRRRRNRPPSQRFCSATTGSRLLPSARMSSSADPRFRGLPQNVRPRRRAAARCRRYRGAESPLHRAPWPEASSSSCSSVLPDPRVNALSPTPAIHALSFTDSIYFIGTPGAAPMSPVSFT